MRASVLLALSFAVACPGAPFGAIGARCASDAECDPPANVCRAVPDRDGSFCLPGAAGANVPCVSNECGEGTVCTEVVGAGTRCVAPTPSDIRIEHGGFYAIPGGRGQVPETGIVILRPRLAALPVVTGCAPDTTLCIHAGELK